MMEDNVDVMVSSVDIVTSSEERSEYVASYERLEENGPKKDDVPEYATITTSRLRQHDPPVYLNHRGGDSSSNGHGNNEEVDRILPEEDASPTRVQSEEDKIEVLSSSHEDEPLPYKGSNGFGPPGWVVGLGTTTILAAASAGPGDDNTDASPAMRNAKILGELEKQTSRSDRDDCLVDCLYYTTTCCECTIL